MPKSLTETAKSILMKEEGIPSMGAMDAGAPERDAKKMTPNMSTLRPKSKSSEADPKHNEAEDLGGQTPTSGMPKENLGAKAAVKGKDSSKPTVGAKPAQPMEKMVAEEEQLDEIKSDTVYNAASVARRRSSEASLYGKNVKSRALAAQADRLQALADKKNEKEQVRDLSSGKRKAMGLEEEIEISEELEAFISEMLDEGYSEEEIAEAIEENFEIVEAYHDDEDKRMMKEAEKEDEDEDEEDEKEKEEEDKKMMKEHIDALLSGEQLSEEFRSKAETIFESAVSIRVQERVSRIEEAYAEALEEEVAKIRAELTEQVDDYLNYVVEQWVAENEVAIESGLRSELTEDFISGLRNLFAEHYIDLPDEKVSVVEELAEKVEELETKLNEEIERNVGLNKILAESKKNEILFSAMDGLTDTQAEKLKTLSEGIEFTDIEEYSNKVNTLKENYFRTKVSATNHVLDDESPAHGSPQMISENLNGPMAAYVRTLGKTLPK